MEEKKERLDILLTELGYSISRERARSQIMAGNVYVNGQKVDKPGTKISSKAAIEVKGDAIPYVSRGGLKLEKAIVEFNIDLQNKVVLDIGASTGGFTDCALQNGASKVFSIDVGYGQLAWKLRTDSRVVCMERTNVRNVTKVDTGEDADFATIDVSFISLVKVIPPVLELLSAGGRLICLIKPQFEAGREKVGKKGVVRDKEVHIEVITRIVEFCTQEMNLTALGLSFSPIKGPEGNIEYLLYLSKEAGANAVDSVSIRNIVEMSHNNL